MRLTAKLMIGAIGVSAFALSQQAAQAAVMHDDEIVVTVGVNSAGYENAGATFGGVGRSNADDADFRTLVSFNTADILTDLGLTLGNLATTPLEFSFNITPGALEQPDSDLPDLPPLPPGSYSYRVKYLGFFVDANLPSSGGGFELGDWNTANNVYSTSVAGEVDTGIADTSGDQSISASSFNLTGVTESTGNDFVVFGIRYNESLAGGVSQFGLTDFELDVVPEPASLVLLGLGSLMIMGTRKHHR